MSDTGPQAIAVDKVSAWISDNVEVDGAVSYTHLTLPTTPYV